jgi:hypothetical protein
MLISAENDVERGMAAGKLSKPWLASVRHPSSASWSNHLSTSPQELLNS